MENSIDIQKYFAYNTGVVTLIGSTKFFNESMEVNRRLTFQGWIVLQCGSWGHSFHRYAAPLPDHSYDMVKKLHYIKMAVSDCVVVVTDGSYYMGDSTRRELTFALDMNLPVAVFDGDALYEYALSTSFENQRSAHMLLGDDEVQRIDRYHNLDPNSLSLYPLNERSTSYFSNNQESES